MIDADDHCHRRACQFGQGNAKKEPDVADIYAVMVPFNNGMMGKSRAERDLNVYTVNRAQRHLLSKPDKGKQVKNCSHSWMHLREIKKYKFWIFPMHLITR